MGEGGQEEEEEEEEDKRGNLANALSAQLGWPASHLHSAHHAESGEKALSLRTRARGRGREEGHRGGRGETGEGTRATPFGAMCYTVQEPGLTSRRTGRRAR